MAQAEEVMASIKTASLDRRDSVRGCNARKCLHIRAKKHILATACPSPVELLLYVARLLYLLQLLAGRLTLHSTRLKRQHIFPSSRANILGL